MNTSSVGNQRYDQRLRVRHLRPLLTSYLPSIHVRGEENRKRIQCLPKPCPVTTRTVIINKTKCTKQRKNLIRETSLRGACYVIPPQLPPPSAQVSPPDRRSFLFLSSLLLLFLLILGSCSNSVCDSNSSAVCL